MKGIQWESLPCWLVGRLAAGWAGWDGLAGLLAAWAALLTGWLAGHQIFYKIWKASKLLWQLGAGLVCLLAVWAGLLACKVAGRLAGWMASWLVSFDVLLFGLCLRNGSITPP
jgi:hypothetical protein